MLAIMVVGITSLISMILSYNIYCLGGKYKYYGVQLFRGTLGFIAVYTFMVLLIGMAPSNF